MPNLRNNPESLARMKWLLVASQSRRKILRTVEDVKAAYPYSDLRIDSFNPEIIQKEAEHQDAGFVALTKSETAKSKLELVSDTLGFDLQILCSGLILGMDVTSEGENEHGELLGLHRISRQIKQGLTPIEYRKQLNEIRENNLGELMDLTKGPFSIRWKIGHAVLSMTDDRKKITRAEFIARFRNFPADKLLRPLYQPREDGSFAAMEIGARATWAEFAGQEAFAIEQIEEDGHHIPVNAYEVINSVANCVLPSDMVDYFVQVFTSAAADEATA